jgi:type I restriction enzyme S subunit
VRHITWPNVSLSEISSDVSYGYTASAKEKSVGPKFLRITDIRNYFIDWSTVPYCEISDSDHKKYRLQVGDICIARTGASTGDSTVIKQDIDAVFASYLVRFQIAQQRADPFFVGFILKSDLFKRYIDSVIGGSAQPNANAKQLGGFVFSLPPLPIQRRIAAILGALDDKIEVNRRINRTLEAMAGALYKHWFVDFEPFQDGEFVESEVGLIPEGWEVATLNHFVDIDTTSIQPTDYPDEVFDHYSIPALDEGLQPAQEFGAEVKSNKYLITSDRILVSKLNPRFYRIWTVYPKEGYRSFSSTEFINYVRKQPNTWAFMNCHLRSQEFIAQFRSHVAGTTGSRQRVPPKETLSFRCLQPDKDVLHKFESVVSPYFKLIPQNADETQILAATRDYLLPRLLSGEIPVEVGKEAVGT